MIFSKRLNSLVLSVLVLSMDPVHAAIFNRGGSATPAPDTGPQLPSFPPNLIPIPKQSIKPSSPSPATGSSALTPPSLAAATSEMTPQQAEMLKAELTAASKDPKRLAALIETYQKMQGISAGAKKQAPSAPSSFKTDNGDEEDSYDDPVANAQYEYEQAQALTQAGEGLDDQAFNLLLQKALPLSPDQIKKMHKLYNISQEATAASPVTPPTPVSSSSRVSLDPGKTPPVVRLAAGFVTSIVFTDSTGAPWPLVSYTLGDPTSFNIQWDQRSNTLFIQSLKLYTHGNLAVNLYGLSTPVMLSMVSGQKQVDFRIDFQVAGRGPEATAPIMPESFLEGGANPILINILDGVPPSGSLKLNVSGNYGEAWTFGDKLYFRTRLTVLSPAWLGTVSSPDGMHVYEMMNTPTVLASKDGQTVDIRLTG